MQDPVNNSKTNTSQRSTLIENVNVLTSDGWLENSRVELSGGKIRAVGADVDGSASVMLNGHGGYLLPGIIDLHGDAFERHITPRAGTVFPLDLALAANDASLIANGITTFYYSITDGFEPGPRSRETVRRLLLALENLMPRFSCQSRVHIRHEKVNTELHDELMSWIAEGRIHMLSLNDHLPELDNPASTERYLTGFRRRVTMDEAETGLFLKSLQGRRNLGESQTYELVRQAHQAGVSLSSHDDQCVGDVEHNRTLSTTIAEFPMNAETANASLAAGAAVLMGAPNLIRGGSHVGAISVRDAIEQNLVSILCSDYHYPSLFCAPFVAAEQGLMPLAQAWKLVSENPAKAVGLGASKGRIAPGFDADLLLLSELDGSPLSLQATVVGGKSVFQRSGCFN